jgi:predicted GIY-YIG superfamily endonuclease
MAYRIYKITSQLTDLVYIGSTAESLHCRLLRHKNDLKLRNSGKTYKYPASSKTILDIDPDATIELIEEADTRDEAIRREANQIMHYREQGICVNKMTPGYTKKTRVNCTICEKELSHGYIKRHIKKVHN